MGAGYAGCIGNIEERSHIDNLLLTDAKHVAAEC